MNREGVDEEIESYYNGFIVHVEQIRHYHLSFVDYVVCMYLTLALF